MAAIHNTGTFFQSSTKIVRKIYAKVAVKVKPLYQEIFATVPDEDGRSYFTYQPIVELGTFANLIEGGIPALDQSYEGTPTTFNFVTYALMYEITDDARLEDAKKLLRRLPGFLAYSEQITQELLIWNILNLGFSVNGADGVPLFSASHPLAGPQGGTISNTASNLAFSPEALQTVLINFQTLASDRNLPQYRTPEQVVAPPQLQKPIEETLNAKYYPYSAENRPNVVAGALSPVISRYLTSSTAWYVLGKKQGQDLESDGHSLLYSFKYRGKTKSGVDEKTDNFFQKSKFRLTYGWADFRGAWGTQGS